MKREEGDIVEIGKMSVVFDAKRGDKICKATVHGKCHVGKKGDGGEFCHGDVCSNQVCGRVTIKACVRDKHGRTIKDGALGFDINHVRPTNDKYEYFKDYSINIKDIPKLIFDRELWQKEVEKALLSYDD